MKNIFLKLMTLVMVAAFALPTMAQFGNQDQNTAPTVTFQSTGSTMMSSGSTLSANPTLNEEGMATYNGASYSPAKAPGGPHRVAPKDGDDEDYPLGDAVLPLLLMAMLFAGVVYTRRKRC